jgi:hypothetical protein
MKSSKAEVQKRIEQIFKLRLGGAEFADILQYAAAPEQNWGVKDRQLWTYIARADALMKERFDAKADHLLARHLLQRRLLYAQCMAAGAFGDALRVLQDEAKLEGLYPASKTELTGKDGKPIQTETTVRLSDEQRAAAIAAIFARVGQASNRPDRNGTGTAP